MSVGITLGDIGAKFSSTFNGGDNGYLMFDHVRIPLNHMLMGLAKVHVYIVGLIFILALTVVTPSG